MLWWDAKYKLHSRLRCVILAEDEAVIDMSKYDRDVVGPTGGGWVSDKIGDLWRRFDTEGNRKTDLHLLHTHKEKFSVVMGAKWLMAKYADKLQLLMKEHNDKLNDLHEKQPRD